MKWPNRLEWMALALTLLVAAVIAALAYFAPLAAGLFFLSLLAVGAASKRYPVGKWDRLLWLLRNLLAGW
jgi:hypothetical protein